MTWHNALFFIASEGPWRRYSCRELREPVLQRRHLRRIRLTFRRTERGTRGCTPREKGQFYHKGAVLAVERQKLS